MALPKRINPIRGVSIDDEDNLWISTEKPDNYRNASVYKWLAQDWAL